MALTVLPSPTAEEPNPIESPPPRPLKRKRTSLCSPITPPAAIEDPSSLQTIERAVHVLSTEATALSHVTRLYQTDPTAKHGLLRALETIVRTNEAGGKLIICGVGKSGLVGMKTVATMKSLGLVASFMHAAEALHGDLGDVRPNDALLFITFSGRTPELLNLLPHIPSEVPVMVLTSHTTAATCPLLMQRPDAILLPGPIHEPEEESFGVSAPTTSTTVAMAVGDMLALTAADKIHGRRTREVFRRNHPGGAIGARVRDEKERFEEGARTPESV